MANARNQADRIPLDLESISLKIMALSLIGLAYMINNN